MKKKISEILSVTEAYDYKLSNMKAIPIGRHYMVLLYEMYPNTDSVQRIDQYIFPNREEMVPFIKYLYLDKRKFIFFEVKGLGQLETQLKLNFPK